MATLGEQPHRSLTPRQVAWGSNLLALVIGTMTWLSIAGFQWETARALFWTDLALGVVCLAAMQFRCRWPLAVTMLTAAATAISASATGPWVVSQASLSTRRRWREILPTFALAVLTGQIYRVVEPNQDQTWYTNLLFCFLVPAAIVAIGMYVGARRDLLDSRRDLIASLRDRADRAEREQALQVATARASERTRIAREMHDVLAHRMSLVALHAGALAYRTDLTPTQTRETAGIIQANSQRALADLREILGLLRDTERGIDATDHRPQPTLADLDSLLDDERAAGARITLRSGLADLDALPESIGRSAYRIVQEGLTNARKHAPHATVTVELAGSPGDGLDLSVRNPLRVGGNGNGNGTDGAGFGLVGLAERAAASHGRFQHGLTPTGDFILRAWLPWER